MSRIPYAKEVAVIQTRLAHSLQDTARMHELSMTTVKRIWERNPQLVERFQTQLVDAALKAGEGDARTS